MFPGVCFGWLACFCGGGFGTAVQSVGVVPDVFGVGVRCFKGGRSRLVRGKIVCVELSKKILWVLL